VQTVQRALNNSRRKEIRSFSLDKTLIHRLESFKAFEQFALKLSFGSH